MAEGVYLPKWGMQMEEGRVAKWLVSEGDVVNQGDPIVEIETEKIVNEVEVALSGKVGRIVAKEGDVVKIGGLLAVILGEGETSEACDAIIKKAELTTETPEEKEPEVRKEPPALKDKPSKRKISPLSRKMAEEHNIDISRITGTGPKGRIVKADILKAMAVEQESAEVREKEESLTCQGKKVKESVPLKGIRKSIAEHMHGSLSGSAQMTIMGEFEMSELIKFRESLVAREEKLGLRIGYIEILVFIIARALGGNPNINCSLIDDNITIWDNINIGVAVALGDTGLIVPVVKDADKKTLIEVSNAVQDLAKKARNGTLLPDEVTGGTFTLTSVGRNAVSTFQTPILNQPEAAILATGSIMEKPVVKEGCVVAAPLMPYSLTFDHRVVNGFGAERFLKSIHERIETPGLLVL